MQVLFHTSEAQERHHFEKESVGKVAKLQIVGAEIPPAEPMRATGSDLSLLFGKLRIDLNGCPTSPMRNFSQVHDIIEFSCFSLSRISEEIASFENINLSLSEISNHTSLKRTTIWKAKKLQKRPIRVSNAVPYDRWRKGHKRTGARPPYGFCFLLGEVVPEPKEYPTLLLLHKLWNNDESRMSILNKLEERGLKSRTGKAWSYGVIKSIIKRFEADAIVLRQGKLHLSDDFLKGIILPNNKTKKKRGMK
ncbi:hypothetical protein BDW_10300 [Bdellovibrio bacteriovorus W]|nr:hypothetical protein BDW_10300 [Bdellovibrio bacteriovorus W]